MLGLTYTSAPVKRARLCRALSFRAERPAPSPLRCHPEPSRSVGGWGSGSAFAVAVSSYLLLVPGRLCLCGPSFQHAQIATDFVFAHLIHDKLHRRTTLTVCEEVNRLVD